MGSELELYEVIYSYLLTQIQFGFYHQGENLPGMEELSQQSHLSMDTVTQAYHRLCEKGYITLTKKAGAKVSADFTQAEIRNHIQRYFAQRETALRDVSHSIWPLFGWALWLSLKHTPPEAAQRMMQLAQDEHKPPTMLWQHIEHQYGALGNPLLMRITRYLYLFFQGPFYSVKENMPYYEKALAWQHSVTVLCDDENWNELRIVLKSAQDDLTETVSEFYREQKIIALPQVSFRWNAYKKTAQLRYSLAIELLTDISRGLYPAGSFLPSAQRLADEKGVSVSTIRRTLTLLNGIGAVKSSRTRGAQVLSPAQSTESADLTQPDILSRLLDMAASLQIYTLSAKATARLTLEALDGSALEYWKERLSGLRTQHRLELVAYVSMELIAKFAPSLTIRTIYSELLQLFFWGNPLRGMRESPDVIDQTIVPYYKEMIQALESRNFPVFSAVLEELLIQELRDTVSQLIQLNVPGAKLLLIPGDDEIWV